MINHCKENLQEIKHLIAALKQEQYQCKSQLLSDASIGQHVRHILEFYLCIIQGVSRGLINYENRNRDLNLEENPSFAIEFIDQLCAEIQDLNPEQVLELTGHFCHDYKALKTIKTSINRELAYCLEHSIHHQALIKIGLIDQKMAHLISDSFGVAPSTIEYRQQCAR